MTDGETVLVTGGCGSIGSAIVRSFLQERSSCSVHVVDHNEHNLFTFERELARFGDRVRFTLADVRERDSLVTAMGDAETVVHTAGLKHVPLNESFPYEAVKTNVTGTQHVIEAARHAGVETVLGLSTDKAVTPTSTMGATKMLAERLLIAADAEAGDDDPAFGCIRLGNMIESNGSVYRTFADQIARGGPVTITHPEMTRFILPYSDAVAFVHTTLEELDGGEIHVPKMDAVRIEEVAKVMIDRYGDPGPPGIDLEVIGIRPGERLHERLFSDVEVRYAVEESDRYVLSPALETASPRHDPDEMTVPPSSETASHLTREEIDGLLAEF